MVDGKVVLAYRAAFGDDPVDSYLGMEMPDLQAAMRQAIDRGRPLTQPEIRVATGGWDGKVEPGTLI